MMITDNFLLFIGNKLCLHFFICSRSALWSGLFGSDDLVQTAHKLSQYTPNQFVLKLSNRPVRVANVQAVTWIRLLQTRSNWEQNDPVSLHLDMLQHFSEFCITAVFSLPKLQILSFFPHWLTKPFSASKSQTEIFKRDCFFWPPLNNELSVWIILPKSSFLPNIHLQILPLKSSRSVDSAVKFCSDWSDSDYVRISWRKSFFVLFCFVGRRSASLWLIWSLVLTQIEQDLGFLEFETWRVLGICKCKFHSMFNPQEESYSFCLLER